MKFLKGILGGKTEKPEVSNDMDSIQFYYSEIVNWFASHAPDSDWRRAKIACKIFDDSSHGTFHYLVGDKLAKKSSRLSIKERQGIYKLFKELRSAHQERNEDWVGCYFTCDNHGKFNIKYVYEDCDVDELMKSGLEQNT